MVQPPALGPSSSSAHSLLSHLVLLESVNDLIIISLIATIVVFSLISLVFIIHFHFKSQESHALKNFNSLCSVRILLVTFISLWALTEFLRLPFTRLHLFSYLPHFTPDHQANICRLHIVLSFGLFEPGFLVTLLFLLSFSIKKKDPNDTFGNAVGVVLALCLPVLILQIYFVFFPNQSAFSELLWRSHLTIEEFGGESLVLCMYPLFGTIIFGTFGLIYTLYFLFASCKVLALVINKGLRIRLYALMLAVTVAVPLQITLLVVSTLWNPINPVYNGITLVMFLIVLLCATVGEGILVIRPIADALAVGKALRWWKGGRSDLPIVFGDGDEVVTGVMNHAKGLR